MCEFVLINLIQLILFAGFMDIPEVARNAILTLEIYLFNLSLVQVHSMAEYGCLCSVDTF